MSLKEIKYKGFLYLTAFAFFLIPLNGRIPAFISEELSHINFFNPVIGALFLLAFIQDSFQPLRPFKNIFSLAFFALYVLYILSVFTSQDYEAAISALEYKMVLFFVPFIFFSHPGFFEENKEKLLLALILGVLVVLTILDIKALFFWQKNSYFPDYIAYASSFHPTYIGISVFFVMVLCVRKAVGNSFVLNSKNLIWLLLAVVLVMHLVLLQSRTVLLCLLLLLVFYACKILFRKNRYLLLLFFSSLFAIGYFMKDTRVAGRIREVFEVASKGASASESGTGFRMNLVKSYPDILEDVWLFGTGKGDAQEYLNAYYEDRNWKYARHYSFNAHNQFIQLWIEFGLLGFLLLLFILFFPFIVLKDQYFKIFLFCFSFSMLLESLLERQLGLMLFIFIYCLFTSGYEKTKKVQP